MGRLMNLQNQNEELTRKLSWIERVYTSSVEDVARPVHATAKSLQSLPSFFVIGPPRTGTTWLYEVLQEKVLLPGSTKETRFFDVHFHRGLDWYAAHFPRPVPGRVAAEIAPTYFVSSPACERIARLIPSARIVCTFRNPVHRVLSLYKLKCAYGMIRGSFEQAMERDPELLESSKYATRLKEWRLALGNDQVLATLYDDLRDQPQTYLDRFADFVNIPRTPLTPSQLLLVHSSETMTHPRSYNRTRHANTLADWFKARRLDGIVAAARNSPLRRLFLGGGAPFTELPKEIVLNLYRIFRPEVEELETILNRDLSAWKTAG